MKHRFYDFEKKESEETRLFAHIYCFNASETPFLSSISYVSMC